MATHSRRQYTRSQSSGIAHSGRSKETKGSPLPSFIEPGLAELRDKPPNTDQWVCSRSRLVSRRRNVRQTRQDMPHSSRSKTKQNQDNVRPAGTPGAALSHVGADVRSSRTSI